MGLKEKIMEMQPQMVDALMELVKYILVINGILGCSIRKDRKKYLLIIYIMLIGTSWLHLADNLLLYRATFGFIMIRLVFDEKIITMAELIDALKNNWQGYAELRAIILKKGDFFGNDPLRTALSQNRLDKSNSAFQLHLIVTHSFLLVLTHRL